MSVVCSETVNPFRCVVRILWVGDRHSAMFLLAHNKTTQHYTTLHYTTQHKKVHIHTLSGFEHEILVFAWFISIRA